MSELKPCPFCGGEVVEGMTETVGVFAYECKRCKAITIYPEGGITDGKWNTRAHAEEIEEIDFLEVIESELCGGTVTALEKALGLIKEKIAALRGKEGK